MSSTIWIAQSFAAPPPDLREEFAKLESDMSAAEDTYLAALESLDQPEDGRPHSGENKPQVKPPDGRVAVLKRMDALVDSATGSPDAAFLTLQTFLWSVGIEPEAMHRRFQKVMKVCVDESDLAEFVLQVPSLYDGSEAGQDWAKSLDQLANMSKNEQVRLASRFASARIFLELGRLPDAKKSFEDVIKQATDPDLQRLAKGFVFEVEHLQVGMSAPDFQTKSLDGKDVALQSFRGKIVLIDFWATWCPNCISDIPRHKETVSRLSGKPFEIIGVSVDADREALARALKVLTPPGVQTWDPKGEENPIAELFNVQELPTSFLIDRDGAIRARDYPTDRLAEAVEALLDGKPLPPAKPQDPIPSAPAKP
ncbi:MAG: TlpA disulfide reductase family protein [Planctomycetota bacterium]